MRLINTVLLVDDDADDREFFREALLTIDPTILYLTSIDGADALQLLNTPHTPQPDLIFLDLNMPRMDGRQCLVELKKSKRFQPIPVIMYSTSQQRHEVEETRKLGAASFVTKPSTFDGIVAAITQVLNKDWAPYTLTDS